MKALLGATAIAIGLSGVVAHDPPKKPKRKPVVRLEDEGNGAIQVPPDEAPAAPVAAPSPPVSDAGVGGRNRTELALGPSRGAGTPLAPAPIGKEVMPNESVTNSGAAASPLHDPQVVGRESGQAWQETRASWYGYPPAACYDRGRRTPFPRGEAMWTAHKTLPCGTVVEVEHAGRTIRVAVRDRGPYVGPERELDLSAAAFSALAPTSQGVIPVRWRVAG